MQIGRLNRRVQVQSQTTTQDAVGQEQQTWSQVYACWASIDVLRGQLTPANSELVSKATHNITIRYTSSVLIAANQRVIYTEAATGVVHTYFIEAVLNPKQGNVELNLLVYEIAEAE
jgi:SPP1 family predicted phage head-tail adaptor